MANQVTPLKTRYENCVDDTIINTPLPAATSTVNNNLSPRQVVPKPVQKPGTTSRLTNTIKEVESLSKALSNAGKTSFSRDMSGLITDNEIDRTFESKSSLGLLDVDKLLGNEVMNNSQDIMESLYQIRDKRMNMRSKVSEKPAWISGNDPLQPNKLDKSAPGVEYSMQGVPSCFLDSESYISEGPSIDSQSFTTPKELSMSETSAEVAAIMQKDSSFTSGRLTFEPSELSARSTSLGGSDESSRNFNLGISSFCKNNTEMGFEDEQFIGGNDLIKELESAEKSCTSKQLPPIIPGCIPDPQKLELTNFSGVVGEGQLVVRPSWIGLEGYGDEPINMSATDFFQLKSDVLSDTVDGHNSESERPNFGMDIRSPKRRGPRMALVSDSFVEPNQSACKKTTTEHKLNETQVLTPQRLGFADESVNGDDNPSCITESKSVVATPSISCIDNILSKINENDSPATMARKFLEDSTSSNGKKTTFDKNISVHTPINNNRVSIKSQLSTQSKNVDDNESGKAHNKAIYLRNGAAEAKWKESKKYGIPDLIKKLNSVEIGCQGDSSSLRKVESMVQKLKHDVPGPLDCSALYESLTNKKYIEEDSHIDDSIMSNDSMQAETKFASPNQECDKERPWVKIPEEILLPTGEENILKKQHCVGIGSTFHVPITNVTGSWLMYEVTFLKKKSEGNVVVQKLPVPTLISPESCVEFEAIVVPILPGRHSILLEIKVTNFMAQGNSSQVYICKLVLEANVPKVMLMTENMKELKVGDALDFGLLPEDCTKNIQLIILNVGKSDIPIRVVIDEMPSLLQPFEIHHATRSPAGSQDKNQLERDCTKDGFILERRDLLACDLLGSGPHSIVALSLAFISPKISRIPHNSAYNMDPSKIIKLSAKLKIELDFPSSLPSNVSILREVPLNGFVGKTDLVICVTSEPLILCSEEVILPLDSNERNLKQSRGANEDHKIYKPMSEYIPICNSGVLPLDLNIFIHSVDGTDLQNNDVMMVDPNTLTIQPGEKFLIKVTYHPTAKEVDECDRILILQVNPNGATYKVQLKGLPPHIKSGHSLPNKKRTRPRLSQDVQSKSGRTDVIQASQTALVWGSVPVGSYFAENGVALRNPTEMVLRVTITVNGSDDFKFLNHYSDMVGQASFDLLPKKTEKLKFFFRPKKMGPASGKVCISTCDMRYPDRSMANKMLVLLGYGGHSEIEAISLPKDLTGRPWFNLGLISAATSTLNVPNINSPLMKSSRPSTPSSSSVKNRIQIYNSGTLPAFVKITPMMLGVDLKSLSHLEEGREHQVTVRPDEFQLAPSCHTTVWINYVHGNFSENTEGRTKSSSKGNKRIQEEVAKLFVVSGDVPTRTRLQRIYKIADATDSIKSSDRHHGLNIVTASFIEAVSSNDEFQLEGHEDCSQGENALYDPVTKEAINSLVQNVATLEVILTVEKNENQKEDPQHSVGDLTLALESSSLEFCSLLDYGDTNLFQIPVLQSVGTCLGRRQANDLWAIEPEGTVYLGLGQGISTPITLRSYTNTDLFFETKLGIKDEEGSVSWLLPSQRQAAIAANCPLSVEPKQGQLPPYGTVVLKASLPQLSSCSSNDAVLLIFSENHSLKVNIRIEGWGTGLMSKPRSRESGDFRIHRRSVRSVNEERDNFLMENPSSKGVYGYREYVYADTSALIFPTTKVGDRSSGKLTLKNISSEPYEVHFQLMSGPFSPPKKQVVVAGQKHLSFKVKFEPQNPGFYETTMIMNATSQTSSSGNVITVSLKGKAIL